MKLPLRWGLVVLGVLLGGASWLPSGGERSGLLLLAMGAALWTAFSLNITPRSVLEQPPPEEEDTSPEEAEGQQELEQGQPAEGLRAAAGGVQEQRQRASR